MALNRVSFQPHFVWALSDIDSHGFVVAFPRKGSPGTMAHGTVQDMKVARAFGRYLKFI